MNRPGHEIHAVRNNCKKSFKILYQSTEASHFLFKLPSLSSRGPLFGLVASSKCVRLCCSFIYILIYGSTYSSVCCVYVYTISYTVHKDIYSFLYISLFLSFKFRLTSNIDIFLLNIKINYCIAKTNCESLQLSNHVLSYSLRCPP